MCLSGYKHAELTLKPNFLNIPCNVIDINDEGVEEFNKIYFWAKEQGFNKIERTKSGGICVKNRHFRLPCWDVRRTNACIEMTICCLQGFFRFQFRVNLKEKTQGMYGRQAFKKFKDLCLEQGIDLNDYAIDNGAEVKKTIPSYIIEMERETFKGKTFEHAFHVDFHNSFPAGLCNTHPEFRPVVEPIYEARKDPKVGDTNKAILNFSIGFMQSISSCQARWAHLAKDAIQDNNDRVRELAERMKKTGKITVLAYNTDGIWAVSEDGRAIKGKGMGDKLGEWHVDHKDCTIRFKSKGCYEFIENGVYTPVVRGLTNYDRIQPDRTKWKWGDIYRNEARVLQYKFDEERGIIKV